MSIMLNPSNSEFESEVVVDEDYGDEVLCAGWNPQLALAVERPATVLDKHTESPFGQAKADVEHFLQDVYRYAS